MNQHLPQLRPHRRQFLLGPRPVLVDGTYQAAEPWAGQHLSHATDLPVSLVEDTDGGRWALVGWAFQSDPARKSPAEEIASLPTRDVIAARTAWAGRWVLIGKNEVIPDAGAFQGIFYRRLDTEAEGELWVSSSPALLDELQPCGPEEIDPRELGFCVGVYWYPPPRTRFRPIRRLLPSQCLRTPGGELRPLQLLIPGGEDGYEGQLECLAEALVTTTRAIARSFRTTWVAVSAGHDSRVVLAAAISAGSGVRTFTHDFPIMPEPDRMYAPVIAQAAGCSHLWVRPNSLDPRLLAVVDQHTAGHAAAAIDRQFLATGQWEFGAEDDVVLRGGGFEVGRNYYHAMLADDRGAIPEVETIIRGLRGEPTPDLCAGMSEWRDWVRAHPSEVPLDWRDRLCLEQTYGGWFADVEHALTLAPTVSLNPVNCSRTYSMILAIPSAQREATQHQKDLVRLMAPRLAEFPFLQSNVVPEG